MERDSAGSLLCLLLTRRPLARVNRNTARRVPKGRSSLRGSLSRQEVVPSGKGLLSEGTLRVGAGDAIALEGIASSGKVNLLK